VEARVDLIASRRAPARLAAIVESRTGPDVTYLWRFDPGLYRAHLVQVDDLTKDLEAKYGPWSDVARYLCQLEGHWYAVPFYHLSYPGNIILSHWEKIGIKLDDFKTMTWQKFLAAAKELNKAGTPVACAVSQDFDSSEVLFPLLYSHGGRVANEQGKIVLDSAETRAAFNYLLQLFPEMPREVLGWSGADNNAALLAQKIAWTANPATIYAVAKMQKNPVADSIYHVPIPSGPAGHFRGTFAISLGVWKFSPHADLAKDLIRHLLQEETYAKLVAASYGSNEPHLKRHAQNPYWQQIPNLRLMEPAMETVIPDGWPAPPGPATALSITQFVLPVAFAKAASGRLSVDAAVKEAAESFQRIYEKNPLR
jgi:multiple sugar transport system substrate-binding protein